MRIRRVFTTARRARWPASLSREESSLPILDPRPMRLPSKRLPPPAVRAVFRPAATATRLAYFCPRLPPVTRWRPSCGSNSSSPLTACPHSWPVSWQSPTALPCLVKFRCADSHFAIVARHCLYLVVPSFPDTFAIPPSLSAEKTWEQRHEDAAPDDVAVQRA